MAIRRVFSFESTATFSELAGVTTSGYNAPAIVTTAPRSGSQSARVSRIQASQPSRIFISTITAYAVGDAVGVAFGYRPGWAFSTNTYVNANSMVAGFFEGATMHASVGLDSTGHVWLRLPSGSYSTGASVSPAAQDTYAHWEVKFVCHDSTGSCIVKINGVEYLNVSGLDTRNGASGTVDTVVFGCENNDNVGGDSYIDDVVIWDTSGSDVVDFIGDCKVVYCKPSGAGTYAEWTPNTGANYAAVDDVGTIDDDTTYNGSSTVDQRDSFAMDNVAAGSIIAVQTVLRARKDDAGGRHLKPLIRMGGADYLGADINISDGYATFTEVFHNRPSDSADWTDSDVNGLELGYKLIS